MDVFLEIFFISYLNIFFFPKQNSRKYITLGRKYINNMSTNVEFLNNLLEKNCKFKDNNQIIIINNNSRGK